MVKKKMTLDKLAGMVQRGFSDMKKEMHTTVNKAKKELTEKIETESSFVAGVVKRGFDEAEKNNRLAHKQLKSATKDVKLTTGRIIKQRRAEVERDDDQDLSIKDHEGRIVVLEKEKEVV